jgi:hypothetical protein
MSRGPIVSAILEKDAVEDFRTLIGATNQLMQLKVLFESICYFYWRKCSSRF